AIVVLWHFRAKSGSALAEKIAARIAGALLFLVAAFVLLTSAVALLGFSAPRPSALGIVVLLLAALGMPLLANQKRKLTVQISSPALKADAAQSSLCGYLSLIALTGLAINVLFHKSWADPAAALLLVPFVIKEGWEAIRTSRLCLDCH